MKKENKVIKNIFVAGLDVIPDFVLNTKAVKQGLFTGVEMMGAIDCYRCDFNELFDSLDSMKGLALIDTLERLVLHYNSRYSNCLERQLYDHQHGKLILFVKNKIRETESSLYVKLNSDYKPLSIKEMALLYGCSAKTMSRNIKKYKDKGDFFKTNRGRDYSVSDLIKLEQLFGCSFAKK